MTAAGLDILRASPLFDAGWYLARHPDVAVSGLDPARHYLAVGAAIGRDPGPGFATRAYLRAYPDAADSGLNPLVHFERHGRALGYSPDPGRILRPAPPGSLRPAVDVVVPVFNAPDHVRACLASIAAAPTGCDVRVIVIDDASEPETADWLDAACPGLGTERVRFEVVHLPENRGYTAAANAGLRMSSAPHVVLLNSDTEVTPHWLDGMLRAMRSAPDIGLVGPLSNAASWQNVPDLHAGDGFAINPLPEGMTPADMAALVRRAGRGSHPATPVVNGFCYMIGRAVLDRVGYLDEESFPVAYGEETDLCLRAAGAGFRLAYADDTYVYHAKSQSFGSARRKALSDAGLQALKNKHGEDRVNAAIGAAAHSPEMAAMRTRVARALADRARPPATGAMDWLLRQKILFLLPVGAGGGGAHSVVQEAVAMRALGVTVRIATSEFAWEEFRRAYADIPGFETLFVPYEPEAATLVAAGFDVVIATLFSSVGAVEEIVTAYPNILPAYYAQDYEPMFHAPGTPEWDEAHGSYTRLPQMQVFAKTDWIRNRIESAHGVPVAKVSPSLDHDVYYPAPEPDPDGPFRLCAMIRPETPRRGAARTMELLSHLHRLYGSRISVSLFGCDPDDPAFLALPQDFPFEMAGKLTRTEVAALLRRSDLFLDMSDYQAFGRTALEAMACGAVALVPAEGGADEYAVDGINALVADTADVAACARRVARVVDDPALLQRLRLAGLDTAALYSPRRAAMSELAMLATALARHRAAPEAPETVSVPEETAAPAGTAPPVLTPAPAFAGGTDPLASRALTLPHGPAADLPGKAPDIGVHLHLHYPEMVPDFAERLAQIPVPFHLYVSTPEGQEGGIRRRLARALPRAALEVRSFPNRGRDIGPFAAGFGTQLARHDLVAHIHSKRSPHNGAKAGWRAQLLGALLDSPAAVATILRLFAENPQLGMVFPEYHPALADQIGWGTNFDNAATLAERLGLAAPDPGRLALFPAGSMFWARGAALAPLLGAGLGVGDFPAETGQVDGTPAHAVERLLGHVVTGAGFRLLQVRAETPAEREAQDAGT